jgi:hypothetical protein
MPKIQAQCEVTTMDRKKMLELREYYDNHDTGDEGGGGEWVTEVDPDPMVTTSLRLPKSLLDEVRRQARARGIRTTALMREWIEARANQTTPTPPEGLLLSATPGGMFRAALAEEDEGTGQIPKWLSEIPRLLSEMPRLAQSLSRFRETAEAERSELAELREAIAALQETDREILRKVTDR